MYLTSVSSLLRLLRPLTQLLSVHLHLFCVPSISLSRALSLLLFFASLSLPLFFLLSLSPSLPLLLALSPPLLFILPLQPLHLCPRLLSLSLSLPLSPHCGQLPAHVTYKSARTRVLLEILRAREVGTEALDYERG